MEEYTTRQFYLHIQLWSPCMSERVAHGNHTIAHSFDQPQFSLVTSLQKNHCWKLLPESSVCQAVHWPLEPAPGTSWALPRPAEAGSPSSWAGCCCFHLPAAPQCSYCQLRMRTSSQRLLPATTQQLRPFLCNNSFNCKISSIILVGQLVQSIRTWRLRDRDPC